MKANWLNEKLCSFDEKTRIEFGPQLIELECSHDNLRDVVTSPHYRIGMRDALGRIIMGKPPEASTAAVKTVYKADGSTVKVLVNQPDPYGYVAEGEMMTCVDWRAKHKPKVWKIYQIQDTGEVYVKDARSDEAGDHKAGDPVMRFIQIGQDESKKDALVFARTLAGEM